jgi:hypothetical protein
MRPVLAVRMLVDLWQSDILLQICPLFCAESIELMTIEMGSVDASRSYALNPGRRFGIGGLVVEVGYASYCRSYVAWTTLVVGRVTFRVPMCAIDASHSCGSMLVDLFQSEILLQSNPSFCVEYSLVYRIKHRACVAWPIPLISSIG